MLDNSAVVTTGRASFIVNRVFNHSCKSPTVFYLITQCLVLRLVTRYAPPKIAVPQVLVRALDDAALQVRALARAHGIPVVEGVALACLLYATGEAGAAIHPDAYVAVAHVVVALVRDGLLT